MGNNIEKFKEFYLNKKISIQRLAKLLCSVVNLESVNSEIQAV